MEEKNETQVVEEKVEEAAQAEESTPKINIIKLEKNPDINSFVEKSDENRVKLLKSYKKTNTINSILMFVVAAVFVGAFVLITQKALWATITGWSLICVTLAGLITYFLLNRRKYPNLSREYFRTFWEGSNNYLFSDEKFENCMIDIDERYEMADFIAQRTYKDIVNVASRNIVRGKYEGKEFVFGELGLYRPGAKRNARDVVFVGRHLSVDNNLHFEGRFIVNVRKAEEPVDLPTDIDDLKPLYEDGLLTVYGEEGADYKEVIDQNLLNQIQKLVCDAPLLNVNFVFWAGKSLCYLSYDDSIVAIPFENKINPVAYECLKKNIEDVFAILIK